jgi:uncharacterized protein YjcR
MQMGPKARRRAREWDRLWRGGMYQKDIAKMYNLSTSRINEQIRRYRSAVVWEAEGKLFTCVLLIRHIKRRYVQVSTTTAPTDQAAASEHSPE